MISPDREEVEHADEIDNAIPSSGYSSLPVVALGGSAGSIPAMREFFENTLATSGFAYVVVLHLAPDHESTMPALLQRHTAMPVRAAQDGEELKLNTVFVIPPGKHLTVSDGHLRLTDLQHERGRRVAVDLLFRSLADTHGPHATAIVLSGADGDGAIGLKRIKERGGLTIAQDPQEAEHGSMPSSAIATGMVDWVLKAADMPSRIAAYHASATRLRLPPEQGPQPALATAPTANQSESLLREVLALLRARTGRDFSYYKRATIVRRIARRMQVTGVEDMANYLAHVRTNPGEAGALLQDLLISVTNFFRDREAFEAVASHIPELFRDKKPGDSVRVWCAACATGEEVYSMAMLLLEHARKMESPPTLQVFGCDLDELAIQAARTGFYPESIAADVSEERLRNFFMKEPGGYRVRRELREMVLFAAHDLLKDAPFSRMDLVSCRNLLIYLNREAQGRALGIFNFALKPGGLLFLGASETVQEATAMFVPLDKKYRIFRQRPVQRLGLPLPAGLGEASFQRMLAQHERLKRAPVTMSGRAFLSSPLPPIPEAPAGEPAVNADELHFKLLGLFGPSSLVVNAEHEVLHLSENAHRFLQFPEGVPTRHLLRLIHPMLRNDLRAALLRAEETGEPVDIFRRLVDLSGGPKAVDVHVTPAGGLAPGYLLVVFEAHLPTEGGITDVPLVSAALDPAAVVQQLERELTRANANLRANVEQSEASTEELKASNEELQAMNEELRSAGEELETGREELQSVNEELSTVNTEFKNRADELGRANSDLHNLMSATQIATVFLGRELQIMRYTPTAAPLFHLIPGDVGRSIGDLKQRLDYPELTADAEQVLRTLVRVERELRDNGRWLLARMLPYRTLEDHIAGVVLTFVDITERRSAEAALRASEEQFRRAIEEAPIPVIMHAEDGQVLQISRTWTELTGYTREDMPTFDAWLNRAYGSGAEKVREQVQQLFRGDVSVLNIEFGITTRAGERRHWAFSASAPGTLLDGRRFIVGMALDVTERRQGEEGLREASDRTVVELHATARLVEVGNFCVRPGTGVEETLNVILDAAIALTHADRGNIQLHDEATGALKIAAQRGFDEPFLNFFGEIRSHVGAGCGTALASGKRTVVEDVERSEIFIGTPALAVMLQAGARACQSTPLVSSDGKILGIVSTHFAQPHRTSEEELRLIDLLARQAADYLERKQAEEVLRDIAEELTRSSRAKDDFLAALSHELRTPLMPVLMSAAAMESDTAIPAEVREQAGMIRRNIELEGRLIDDMLDLTRISRGKLTLVPEAVDVHQLIEHTAEIVRSDVLSKQVQLDFHLDAARRHTMADPARLQQIFWNLINNALKFTPSGGRVTVSTRNDGQGKIIISVEDTGVGLSSGDLERIFLAFEQVESARLHRPGGLGLGLAICRAIVVMHGGEIHAESSGPGQGTTFSVTLTTIDPPVASTRALNFGPKAGRPLRLLLVEDHAATLVVLARLLTRDGHHVTQATNVRDALTAAAAGSFDVLVSDLGLPDGGGLELMRQIQRTHPIPGIALTGYGMEEDVRRTREAGFFAHLVKPANLDQLRRLLAQVPERT